MNATTNPTTDPANAAELEHDDRGRPERDSEQTEPASDKRTTPEGEYQPKVSNILGHMNCGDYFPDDESERVESAPLTTLKAFRDPASTASRPFLFDDPGSLFDDPNSVLSE